MDKGAKDRPLVAIVYYSFSNQTAKLVHHLRKGFRSEGFDVETVKLVPRDRLTFPLHSVPKTIAMMLKTFFRKRVPIKEIDTSPIEKASLVVLAGPTWSYNPSGPVLSFLDKYAPILAGKDVQPVISCRKYWRTHYGYLKKKIERAGGRARDPFVFTHNVKEPWSTIGTFMTIAGINPKQHALMRKYYPRYGHNHTQLVEMEKKARDLAKSLASN
ncbi:MAG: flavodoxin family protein [Thermodesulfobacteria bacterium]|nr:flavodoxin family protein [Thermodesulfobacteriota bacterium]